VHPRTDNGSGTWDKPMGHDTVLRVITRYTPHWEHLLSIRISTLCPLEQEGNPIELCFQWVQGSPRRSIN
jgi:hypothetical protein